MALMSTAVAPVAPPIARPNVISAGATTLTLPPQIEIERLTELVAKFCSVSLQYPAQKLTGTVRLVVQGPVNRQEMWRVYNQALLAQGFTTVLASITPDSKPIYQVPQVAEAGALSANLTREDYASLEFSPGFVSLIFPLHYLGAENTVKTFGNLGGATTTSVRSLGSGDNRVLLTGSRDKIGEIERLLAIMDVPGVVPDVRLYRPQRTLPVTLQTAVAGMWAAVGRIGDKVIPTEIQIAPDGNQLALITAASAMDRLVALTKSLDQAEPVERRSYRPRYFSLDDVSTLLGQVLKTGESGNIEIIKDKLTNSLLVSATAAQHVRSDRRME